MHNPFIAAQKFIYLSKHHLLVASSKFDLNKDKTWKVLKMASMTIEKIEPIVVSQSLKEPFYFSQWEYQSRTICLVKGTFINHVDTILGSLFSTFWPFLSTPSSKIQSKCNQNTAKMQSKCSQNAVKMQSKCSQNAVKMQPKCSQNAVKIQSKFSHNSVKMQWKCSQNLVKMQSKCSQNAEKK